MRFTCNRTRYKVREVRASLIREQRATHARIVKYFHSEIPRCILSAAGRQRRNFSQRVFVPATRAKKSGTMQYFENVRSRGIRGILTTIQQERRASPEIKLPVRPDDNRTDVRHVGLPSRYFPDSSARNRLNDKTISSEPVSPIDST